MPVVIVETFPNAPLTSVTLLPAAVVTVRVAITCDALVVPLCIGKIVNVCVEDTVEFVVGVVASSVVDAPAAVWFVIATLFADVTWVDALSSIVAIVVSTVGGYDRELATASNVDAVDCASRFVVAIVDKLRCMLVVADACVGSKCVVLAGKYGTVVSLTVAVLDQGE